jgi:outer membrane protein assembly factor BamB
VSNARSLLVLVVLAVALAAAAALGGVAFFRAAVNEGQTHLYSASDAPTAWTTHWFDDREATPFRSALPLDEGTYPPQMAGQFVYALGMDHRLHALDPRTGNQRWSFGYSDGRRIFGFRISGPRLLLLVRQLNPATSLADSELVALDLNSRGTLWERPLDADVFDASLQSDAAFAYLAVADNVDGGQLKSLRDRGISTPLHPRARAYSLADGGQRWEQALPERADVAPVEHVALVLTDGQVVASERASASALGLTGIDVARGRVLWQDPGSDEALGVAEGLVVIRNGSDFAFLNPLTGRLSGRVTSDATSPGSVVVDHNVAYWAGSDYVVAVDLAAGRQTWRTRLDAPRPGFGSSYDHSRQPGVQGGHLYVGGRDEQVYSINALTGAFEWKFPAERDGPLWAAYAPLRYADLVLVQDNQLTAYKAPR